MGGVPLGHKYRTTRAKHAKNHAIITTAGPYTSYFSREEELKKMNCRVDQLNINFKNKFIIFSDNNDYVFFANAEEKVLSATLIKSKFIADIQRQQFQVFSQLVGKN